MKRFIAAFAIFAIAAGYSAYAFLFFAWVTATPITPEQLKQAQHLASVWFFVFCASFLLAVVSVVLFIRAFRKRKKRTTNNAS
jgi:hypothetical protein